MICLRCNRAFLHNKCQDCGKEYFVSNGIVRAFSDEDESSSKFQEYLINYNEITADDLKESILPRYYHVAQTKKMIRYAGNLKTKSVLDVGVGQGYLLQAITCRRKVAVDISRKYLERLGGQGIQLVQANAENLPFRNEFDVIFMTDILEHVFDPVAVLRSAKRALVFGGKLIIRVPYKEDLSVYQQPGYRYKYVHLRTFNDNSLMDLIKGNGFSVKRVIKDGWSKWNTKNMTSRYIFCNRVTGLIDELIFDSVIANLPNWIGKIMLEPWEITVIASS